MKVSKLLEVVIVGAATAITLKYALDKLTETADCECCGCQPHDDDEPADCDCACDVKPTETAKTASEKLDNDMSKTVWERDPSLEE